MSIKVVMLPDFKDYSGDWITWTNFNKIRYMTLSGQRWRALKDRCLKGGYCQSKNQSYIKALNGFESFNNFVEWSRCQVGYDYTGYQLDKDLLLKGNKIYSSETCVFLPGRVNSLLINRKFDRGELPIGVSFHKRASKYAAYCNSLSSCRKYLGLYNTPEEAFQAYKVYKEALIKQVAEEYKDVIDIRAYNALMSYTVEIDD